MYTSFVASCVIGLTRYLDLDNLGFIILYLLVSSTVHIHLLRLLCKHNYFPPNIHEVFRRARDSEQIRRV